MQKYISRVSYRMAKQVPFICASAVFRIRVCDSGCNTRHAQEYMDSTLKKLKLLFSVPATKTVPHLQLSERRGETGTSSQRRRHFRRRGRLQGYAQPFEASKIVLKGRPHHLQQDPWQVGAERMAGWAGSLASRLRHATTRWASRCMQEGKRSKHLL